MTRRIVASVLLSACVSGGVVALAAPAHAEGQVCIGGDNQRRPGYAQGICVGSIKTGD
jgi:hypothetical protein